MHTATWSPEKPEPEEPTAAAPEEPEKPEPEKPGPESEKLQVPLLSAATKGSKVLQVLTYEGFDYGTEIVLDAGTPIEEYNKVVGFGSLILASPLKYLNLRV